MDPFFLYRTIAQSGLFDPGHYLKTYPDVLNSDIDPILHYVNHGWKEGRSPHPLFDQDYYVSKCEDHGLDITDIDPLTHYIDNWQSIPFSPNPYFDPEFYKSRYADIEQSAKNNTMPFFHYIWFGFAEGRQPSARFVPEEYVSHHPELTGKPVNLLVRALANEDVELGDPAKSAQFRRLQAFLAGLRIGVDRFSIDETLSIRGWLFHMDIPIEDFAISTQSEGDGRTYGPVYTKYHQARLDVAGHYDRPTAGWSGFGCSGLELFSRNDVIFTLDTAEGKYAFSLCKLRCLFGQWRLKLSRRHFDFKLDISAQASHRARWGSAPFLRLRSLSSVLEVIADERMVAPPLPAPVVIMISVYRGRQYLKPMFESLFQNTTSAYHLVLIDNGNDDLSISAYLRAIASSRSNVTLVRVENNRGYVGAMALALHYAPPGHLVVLNTDIVLPSNWLERLMWPIFSDETVATTTPFTNSGTTCGFPQLGVDNPLYLGLSIDVIDEAIGRIRPEMCPIELPSGVGFCMGHNREVVERIGWYDVEAFGRGYGEENDWCLRAVKEGYKNVMVPNLFVYHKHGGTYVSEEKQTLLREHLAIISNRHPTYNEDVEAFFDRDPVGPLRSFMAFLVAAEAGRNCELIFDHSLGGGSNLFRQDLLRGLSNAKIPYILVTWNAEDGESKITICVGDISHAFRNSRLEDLDQLLRRVKVRTIRINQLVEMPKGEPSERFVDGILANSDARKIIYIHDFYYICPSVTLLDHQSRYCGVPDENACRACANVNPHFMISKARQGKFHIDEWRKWTREFLTKADDIVTFSKNTADIYGAVFPEIYASLKISPHFVDSTQQICMEDEADIGLHIGVIGGINEAKGSRILVSLGDAIADCPDESVKLTLIGSTNIPPGSIRFDVTGPYKREELVEQVLRTRVNLIFIPSIWPETFCYVLEEAMSMNMPVVVFDIGAPAERVRLYEYGEVIPMCDGVGLLELLQICQKSIAIRRHESHRGVASTSDIEVIESTNGAAFASAGSG